MPLIQIRSLPFDPPLDVPAVIERVARDFAQGAEIGLENVTVTWDTLQPGHYAVGGVTAAVQPAGSHPVLVDLLAPDLNRHRKIERMLTTVAESLSRHTGVPVANVFVNLRQAHSGMVFDQGKVARWGAG